MSTDKDAQAFIARLKASGWKIAHDTEYIMVFAFNSGAASVEHEAYLDGRDDQMERVLTALGAHRASREVRA